VLSRGGFNVVRQKRCTNEPSPKGLCYCGSGMQYRKCCMRHDKEIYQSARENREYEATFVYNKK